MNFGQKQTMADKMKAVDDRYGRALGASKGYTLKGKIGFTYTQMLRGGMK
ncbi:MAG: hypothetical protein ACLGIP_18450 [Alphaproteobacteria bacterium]